MKFQWMRRCRRTASEQQYIWSAMRIFARLPEARRREIRAMVNAIADTPVEGRALFDMAVRGLPPQAVNARTGVSIERLYRMREEFYDRLPL